jgi:very-short-patch-repair endonuclease
MKTYTRTKLSCIDCSNSIAQNVFNYSTTNFGLPLCVACQNQFRIRSEKSTREALDLYIALKIRGVPAELEKWDGHKTIDIAVTEAKVNIEVDGVQHNFHSGQALADLKRTFFAFKKGYLTLRIPNSLVRYHLEETADYITEFLMESVEQMEYTGKLYQ